MQNELDAEEKEMTFIPSSECCGESTQLIMTQ